MLFKLIKKGSLNNFWDWLGTIGLYLEVYLFFQNFFQYLNLVSLLLLLVLQVSDFRPVVLDSTMLYH